MAATTESNEGKACDAVLRHIESRQGGKRPGMIFPEKTHHVGPVELVCEIGGERYALEHTRIEPFAGHLKAEVEAERHLRPLEAMVAGELPPADRFELQVPFGVLLGKSDREVRPIQEALAQWIIATAPTLPIARFGRVVTPVQKVSVLGVPFAVALHRWKRDGFPLEFQVVYLVARDIELARLDRLRTAYMRKLDKLLEWRGDGARAVLILEENDLQLTNHFLVGDALLEIEKGIAVRPDEVYLLSTGASVWFGVPLRIEGTTFYDLPFEQRYWETGPNELDNITGPDATGKLDGFGAEKWGQVNGNDRAPYRTRSNLKT